MHVLKATGEIEPFNRDKLIDSIKRAGIAKNLQNQALKHVEANLYENIPTSEIYKHITEFLQKKSEPLKVRYGLKQAIMALGPTGYPFEDYVAEILKVKGYKTSVRSILIGKCVSHEIDVIAEKNGNEKLMIEAKFHNEPGTRSDVHVSLYTKARFDDLKEKYNFTKPWLFTNTKLTQDALTYALCVDMGVVSWNYPENESLRDIIETYKLYPITILDKISNTNLQILLQNHILLVKDIARNKDVLEILPVTKAEKDIIYNQAISI
jgi:hypothetical protein